MGKVRGNCQQMQVWVKKVQVLTCCYPADFIKVIQCFQECTGSGVFQVIILIFHKIWPPLMGWGSPAPLRQRLVGTATTTVSGFQQIQWLMQGGGIWGSCFQPVPVHGFSLEWHKILRTPNLRDAEPETQGNEVVSYSVSVILGWIFKLIPNLCFRQLDGCNL